MKFESLRLALTQPLTSALSGFDIVYPNTEYNTAPARNHARVFILSNQPSVATLGAQGFDEHTGVLQVTLYTVKHQTDFTLLRAADALEAAYQAHVRGDYLTNGGVSVRINSIGIQPAQSDAQFYYAPVNIQYTSFIRGL